MSLWSDLLGSIKEVIQEFYDGSSEEVAEIRWASVETKFEDALHLLKSLKGRNDSKAAIALLGAIIPVLERQKIVYGNDQDLFQRVRVTFLELWHVLLKLVKQQSKKTIQKWKEEAARRKRSSEADPVASSKSPPEPIVFSVSDVVIMYRTIGFLMERKEFDVCYLRLDDKNIPHCTAMDMRVAHRYRVLLYHTQAFVQHLLSAQHEFKGFSTQATYAFMAKTLAVNCFRLPKVMKLVLSAVSLSPEEYAEIEQYLPERFLAGDNDVYFSERMARPHSPMSTYRIDDEDPAAASEDAPLRASSSLPSGPCHSASGELTLDDYIRSETAPAQAPPSASAPGSDGAALDAKVLESAASPGVPAASAAPDGSVDLAPSPVVASHEQLPNFSDAPTKHQLSLLTMVDLFPSLFQWPQYHCVMLSFKADQEDDTLRAGLWLKELSRRELLFFLFLKSWVGHVQTEAGENFSQVHWCSLKGYRVLIPAFVHAMRAQEVMSRTQVDCAKAVLLTDPAIINFFVNLVFSRTSVHSINHTMAALSNVEKWFLGMKANGDHLPDSFDRAFFCKAVEILLQTDHSQLMSQTLSFLYNTAEVYAGDTRVAVFIDLLLHKWFFRLFLHWDMTTRNAFYQLLLFKMLRLKRSQLGGALLEDSPTSMQNMEHITDTVIYGKIESYMRILEENRTPKSGQSRSIRETSDYPPELGVYASRALHEYKVYAKVYAKWESSGNDEKPKLVTYNMLPAALKK